MSQDDYLRWLSTGYRVSRREFMGRAAAFGASTAIATSLAAHGAFADEKPKRGGHLILGLEGAASTDVLDPNTYVVAFLYTLGYAWGNGLTELTPDGGVIPELFESWEHDSKAMKWVFKVRKGVQFHNGKELDADDVMYTLNYHGGKDSKSPAKPFFSAVTSMKATGTYEVTIELNGPNLDLPYIFTDYHILVMPKDGDPKAGIGTGGYVIEKFEPGIRATTKRNPNYWKPDRAWADSMEIVGINDATARMSALASGTVNFINRVDTKAVSMVKNSPKLQLIDFPSVGYYYYAMRCDTPPFNNNDLRLALKWGYNRESMKQKIVNGFGTTGNDNPVNHLYKFFADIPKHHYDPDKARAYYKKSGHIGPITLKTADAAFPGAVDAATLYKSDLAKAGITLNVERAPDDGYWNDVWLKAPFCASYAAGRPTVDMVMSLFFLSTAPWNDAYWKRPEFDKLVVAARGELDANKRAEMYKTMQTMVTEDSGMLLPLHNNFEFGTLKNMKGLIPTPVFVGYRAAEQLHFT